MSQLWSADKPAKLKPWNRPPQQFNESYWYTVYYIEFSFVIHFSANILLQCVAGWNECYFLTGLISLHFTQRVTLLISGPIFNLFPDFYVSTLDVSGACKACGACKLNQFSLYEREGRKNSIFSPLLTATCKCMAARGGGGVSGGRANTWHGVSPLN